MEENRASCVIARAERGRSRCARLPTKPTAIRCTKWLPQRGIELICPHKKNRVRPVTQDGRALRRYRRRWIVEHAIGWLGNFRRLVVRYDRSLRIYGALFQGNWFAFQG